MKSHILQVHLDVKVNIETVIENKECNEKGQLLIVCQGPYSLHGLSWYSLFNAQ